MGLKPDILFWVFLMTRGALRTREAREKHLKRSKMMFLLIVTFQTQNLPSLCKPRIYRLRRLFANPY